MGWNTPRRRPIAAICLLAGIVVLGAASPTRSEPPLTLPDAIRAAARQGGVHPDLLASIVWVESRAWPWALNVSGTSLYPRTRAQAEWALTLVGDDVDIGLTQVNYAWWGKPLGLKKADLLDPWTNLVLGALILRDSMSQETGWLGVGRYHSARWSRKVPYAIQVARVYEAIQALRREAHETGRR